MCFKAEDQDAQAVQERQYGSIQEAFNFQHIHKVDNSIEHAGHWSFKSSGFIYLESLLLKGDEPMLGWKFHISIYDEDREAA